MKVKTFIAKGLRKVYQKLSNESFFDCSNGCVYERQSCNDIVYDAIVSGKPFMMTRYGSIEMIVTNTIRVKEAKGNILSKIYDFVTDKTDLPWMDELVPKFISRNAGVFNPTPEILERFAHRYLEDSKIIDILMSVNYKEKFMPLKSDCQFIHFEGVYPYFVEYPWTRALKGKKVLVVHPYAETIMKQYERREKLYKNPDILPNFELITLKAVQSSAYVEVPFKDWFEALKYMEDEIDKIDYDICLLGCGAYGLPLAAHVKRSGKQALHIGGGVQLLFGIKGKRWETEPMYLGGKWGYNTPKSVTPMSYIDYFNDNWVYPSGDEVPVQAKSIEGGCYW